MGWRKYHCNFFLGVRPLHCRICSHFTFKSLYSHLPTTTDTLCAAGQLSPLLVLTLG
jgi:hypothetical protein